VNGLAERVRSLATDAELPLNQGRYSSPLRDERLAALLGAALGVAFSVCFLTGLYSHVQQHPVSWFPVLPRPAGLYRITQGVHVATGIATVPLLVAKLWVVWPRFLSWPPVKGAAHGVERLGLLPLVGGAVFLVFSGVANIAQWYPWRFSFTATHFWTAWITIGALVAHLGAKWTISRRALARPSRRPRLADADPVLGTVAERSPDLDDAAARRPVVVAGAPVAVAGAASAVAPAVVAGAPAAPPAPASAPPGEVGPVAAEPAGQVPPGQPVGHARPGGLSRRGFLTTVAGASGLLTVATLGQTVGPLRSLSVLAPRDPGSGPQGYPVNRGAANAGVVALATSPAYRLVVTDGGVERSLTLDELARLPAREARLPIACVEGWSYDARWRGVPVRDLVALAGSRPHRPVRLESLEPQGAYRVSTLDERHVDNPDTLLATHLDGQPLALDHGFPCRLIAPNRPGVLQTKWVHRLVVL
jgi:hypothetical protein